LQSKNENIKIKKYKYILREKGEAVPWRHSRFASSGSGLGMMPSRFCLLFLCRSRSTRWSIFFWCRACNNLLLWACEAGVVGPSSLDRFVERRKRGPASLCVTTLQVSSRRCWGKQCPGKSQSITNARNSGESLRTHRTHSRTHSRHTEVVAWCPSMPQLCGQSSFVVTAGRMNGKWSDPQQANIMGLRGRRAG
jgi:hypothetical protein